MVSTVHFLTFMLIASILVSQALSSDSNEIVRFTEEELAELLPYMANQEFIRQIHSMMNAYKDDMLSGRMVIETNALIDTKYKTWKRNADLINSILALPKGMNDAGR